MLIVAIHYQALTGVENLAATVQDCMSVVLEKVTEKVQALSKRAENRQSSGQNYTYVETDFVKALKHGYLVEVQEPSTIIQPGVLVGLNSLLEQEGSITLPTGEIIRRHPDTVVIVTTNVSYEGCRSMNQSVVDRMSLVKDIELPEPEVMVQRAMAVTGCADEYMVSQMVQVVNDMADYCRKNSITDGACGMRSLIDWVISAEISGDPYGSRIAANAKLIRHGNLSLEYGEDFHFYDSCDMSTSAQQIETLYLQETAKYGVDNVALLTPYRQKTETGVNALNERLREKLNPQDGKKPEVVYRKRIYRLGDKVMQIKNCEDISNGDIGYITSVTRDDTDSVLTVDFGDGRIAEYDGSDLEMLDLAYASTIHKSQGSEYKSVIINLQCAHAVMLVRPLVYTAITRAKERVLIVGERRALCIAIKRTDTEQRGTMLSARIKELISNVKGDHDNGNLAQ